MAENYLELFQELIKGLALEKIRRKSSLPLDNGFYLSIIEDEVSVFPERLAV
ncbi:MAG TPA: hypothetical protein PLA99_00540 [Candidatus Paceibacterota bacterium]|nr:hypothetical protein [Candidatus Paceibacterota bacterium]HON21715.1 hypothetical protein [Candidatus Paceibacterota bacterium]